MADEWEDAPATASDKSGWQDAPGPDEHPRWDVLGDIWRAGSAAASGAAAEFSKAFPGAEERQAEIAERRQRLNPEGTVLGKTRELTQGTIEDVGNIAARGGHAAMGVLSALGVPAAPVTGTVHALAGSALSYLPGMNKEKADEALDTAMMAVRPGIGKGPTSLVKVGRVEYPQFDYPKTAAGRELLPQREHMERRRSEAGERQAAKETVAKRLREDIEGGTLTATDAIERVNKSREAGRPLKLIDIGRRNVQGLAGTVYRKQGPGSALIESTMEEDVAGGSKRLDAEIRNRLGSETSYQSTKSLSERQKAAADPLFERALAPGSVAPLEEQFQRGWVDASGERAEAMREVQAAERQMTLAQAEKSRAGENVYLMSSALEKERTAGAALEKARANLARAEEDQEASLAKLREAQGAREEGIRGGIWSPYLQRLLGNPRVQQGIRRGLRIARDEADARNQRFDPRDFAVTGLDAEGNPIVGKVPNMRLWQQAKIGLDGLLEDSRNKITGKLELNHETRAILELLNSLKRELYRLNPDYKLANEVWSGPEAMKKAIFWGKDALDMNPEMMRDQWAGMTAGEREQAKIGLADTLRQRIRESGVADPKIRALNRKSRNDLIKDQVAVLFDDEKSLNAFIDAVTDERAIFESPGKVMGGSQTALRHAEDIGSSGELELDVAEALTHSTLGYKGSAIRKAYRVLRDLGFGAYLGVNKKRALEIAKILTERNPDIAKLLAETAKEGGSAPQYVLKSLGASLPYSPAQGARSETR